MQTYPFQIEVSYSDTYYDYKEIVSVNVEFSEEDVRSLVELIRANSGETDVDELDLKSALPDIYEKLDDACQEVAFRTAFHAAILDSYDEGYLDEEVDSDELIAALKEDGLFDCKYDLDEICRDLDNEGRAEHTITLKELDEYTDSAFRAWLDDYFNSLDTKGKIDFIMTYYGEDAIDNCIARDMIEYGYDIVIPEKIVEMAHNEQS